jgi:hypothetical protein
VASALGGVLDVFQNRSVRFRGLSDAVVARKRRLEKYRRKKIWAAAEA